MNRYLVVADRLWNCETDAAQAGLAVLVDGVRGLIEAILPIGEAPSELLPLLQSTFAQQPEDAITHDLLGYVNSQ